MIVIIKSILPTFAMIAMGCLLKRVGFIDAEFRKTSDRLVYFIFFPALLFWKIGTPSTDSGPSNWNLLAAVLCSVFCVAVLSVVVARLTRQPNSFIGSFCQASFRFSSYVGIAVVLSAFGEAGIRDFGMIMGFTIPFINVLCVIILIWFSEKTYSSADRHVLLLKAMLLQSLDLGMYFRGDLFPPKTRISP